MKELIKSMSSLGFSKAGDVILDFKCQPNFTLAEKKVDQGWVYIWLEIDENKAKVAYVGKAGKTLHERCGQHVGGFKDNGFGPCSTHSCRHRKWQTL